METEDRKLALLIDADNISHKFLNIMLNEAKNYGTVSIRRIYGDWTAGSKNNWKSVMLEHSLTPIQQYSYTYGKNASDSAMIIDAMDILYANHVDGFILASSDSDFTRLAMRLREAGKIVIGMGESKTPMPFVKSCDEFKVLDILYKNSLSDEEEKKLKKSSDVICAEDDDVPAPITELSVIKKSMLEIIEKHSDENGQILLSELGRLLTRLYSDFDERNYGKYRKFSEFVRDLPEFTTTMERTVGYVKKADEKKVEEKRAEEKKAKSKAKKAEKKPDKKAEKKEEKKPENASDKKTEKKPETNTEEKQNAIKKKAAARHRAGAARKRNRG